MSTLLLGGIILAHCFAVGVGVIVGYEYGARRSCFVGLLLVVLALIGARRAITAWLS